MRTPTLVAEDFCNYFLSWNDVLAITHLSESTIRRAIKKGTFPTPVSIIPDGRRKLFKKADFYLWIEGRWIK